MALFAPKKKEEKNSKRVAHARSKKPVAGGEHDALRAPWLSEKALIATERGVYTFAVPRRATKAEIAGAIKEVYKVSPRAVRIVNLPGKVKAMRTRRGEGQRAARRKAYVYLNAGDSIQFA
jgi:large subunit ribosomal protein L23